MAPGSRQVSHSLQIPGEIIQRYVEFMKLKTLGQRLIRLAKNDIGSECDF